MLDRFIVGKLLDESKFPVESQRCTHQWHIGSSCRACKEACPHEAIAIRKEAVEVDWEKCTGCGRCIPSCPTEVFAPARRLLEAPGSTDTIPAVHVVCHHTDIVPPFRYRIEGLGAIDDALILGLAAQNLTSIFIHPCSVCTEDGLNLDLIVEEGRLFLEKTGSKVNLSLAPPLKTEVSRREFFSFLSREGTEHTKSLSQEFGSSVARVISPKKSRIPTVPERRSILSRYATLVQEHDRESLFTDLAVSDACDGCFMCSTFCPTGALVEDRSGQEQDEGGEGNESSEVKLVFNTESCTSCDLCIDLCPQDAIDYADWKGEAKSRVVKSFTVSACSRCGQETGNSGLCDGCSKSDRILDFRWNMKKGDDG